MDQSRDENEVLIDRNSNWCVGSWREHRPVFFRQVVSLLIALTFITADQSRAESSVAPKTHQELLVAVGKVLAENHIPGGAIAIVQRGTEPWIAGIGKADLASSRDVTADTQFRVASISKAFTSLAILKLQEDGKIDLNAKLHDVAPEVPVTNPWEDTHPVTVAMLLEHTAGFDDFPSGTQYQRDGKHLPLLEQAKRFHKSLVSRWPPGNRVSYSSLGYLVAGYLIEKITGMPYDEYIRSTLLDPLHMSRSTFNLDLDAATDLATGYDDNPPSVVPYTPVNYGPAWALKSSARELASFVQMLLNRGLGPDGIVLHPDSIDRMEHPATSWAAQSGLSTGNGLGNIASATVPAARQWHTGAAAGTYSEYVYFPKHGVGFIILTNSRVSAEAVFGTLDALLSDFVLAGAKDLPAPGIKLSDEQLKSYEGFYQADNPQDQIYALQDALLGNTVIEVKNGTLHAHPYPTPIDIELVPLAKGQFYAKGQEVNGSGIMGRDELGRDVVSLSYEYIIGSHAVRVDSQRPKLRIWLFAAGVLVTLSAVLFAVVWVPLALVRRLRHRPNARLVSRIAPLLASGCFLVMLYTFATIHGWKWSFPSPEAIRFWLAGWGLGLFSLISVIVSIREWRKVRRVAGIYQGLVTAVCCALAIYLHHWQLLGFKSWTYQ
jgi:CubicO group peptidase (beta-lactamase class C family)